MPDQIAVDTCVLINFLRIDRMDLIDLHPGLFIATEDVAREITYENERSRYERALADGHVVQQAIDGKEAEIRERIFRGEPMPGTPLRKRRLERGESSAIAVAINRNCALASDDEDAIRHILDVEAVSGNQIPILRTRNIMEKLIERQDLSIAQADAILVDWKCNHRFNLGIESFEELL